MSSSVKWAQLLLWGRSVDEMGHVVVVVGGVGVITMPITECAHGILSYLLITYLIL